MTERNVGYSYRTKTDGIVIYQYDGYDVNITVPSKIDGKTVIGLDKNMFKLGASNSGIDIKKIIIPDTIRTIGNQVFNSIPSLTTITIPKNVSSIGLYVWAGSDKLATINVIAANQYFSSANGILYNKAKTEIVAFQLFISFSRLTGKEEASPFFIIFSFSFSLVINLLSVAFLASRQQLLISEFILFFSSGVKYFIKFPH